MTDKIISLANIELNIGTKTIHIGDLSLELSPTSFSLLQELASNAPNVVSVDALLETVWTGKVVNRDVVKQQISALRNQLGEHAGVVESVRGFGYRLNPEYLDDSASPSMAGKWNKRQFMMLGTLLVIATIFTAVVFKSSILSKKSPPDLPLIIAVLPFQTDQEKHLDLSLFLQDELVSMLSRQQDVRSISVSGVNEAIASGFGVTDYAEKLDVDMMFEGSIRNLDQGFKVNVRMVFTKNSVAVWRETINTTNDDHDELLKQVSSALQNMINSKVNRLQKM